MSHASRFLAALALAGLSSLAAAAPATTTEAPATAQPVQAGQPIAPQTNPVTLAAVKAGIFSSVSRINQVMNYISSGSPSGAFLFMPKTLPDQSLFSASIEVQSQSGSPIYASASFAPLASGQAGAVYDAVEYLPQSCDFVEKTLYKDFRRVGLLNKDIVVLDAGSVRIFLMPAGAGCVVIKKEVMQ